MIIKAAEKRALAAAAEAIPTSFAASGLNYSAPRGTDREQASGGGAEDDPESLRGTAAGGGGGGSHVVHRAPGMVSSASTSVSAAAQAASAEAAAAADSRSRLGGIFPSPSGDADARS